MKKSGRKVLSVILTAVMVFAVLPVFSMPMVVKADDVPQEHAPHDNHQDGKDHVNWAEISTWDELKELGEKGGSGYLVNNIDISETFKIELGKTVNLCLNGYSITQTEDKETITVEGTLNLYDKKGDSGKITHDGEKKGNGVKIEAKGTFTMDGGTIIGNEALPSIYGEYDGGGVYNAGTFTMNGGKIIENGELVHNTIGAGVYNAGTFTMNGGTISENNGYCGGGVFNEGTFIMKGGTIEGNEAFNVGGGIFNQIGTLTMEGGTIEGNKAENGGGVSNTLGTFTMEGGTIEGNEAVTLGGGVFNGEIFTMKKGTIKENRAKNGTGVFSIKSFLVESGDIDGSIEYLYGNLCAVTFKACNESNDSIIQYVIPQKDTNLTPNKFNNKGKKFVCWEAESGEGMDTYEDNVTINISKDLILNAQWIDADKITSKVQFKANNGSWSDRSTVKDVEYWRYDNEHKVLQINAADIPTPGNPNKGYKAGSWDTEPDTENALSEDKEYIYTYTFAPIEYTIKYDSNGGTGAMNNQSRTYNDNAALTANAFTFEGRIFDGWNTATDGSGTPFADGEVTGNLSETDQETITLYAQWTIDTFTISWKNYDGTVLETDKNVAYGSTPAYDGETPVRAKEGNKEYTFTGWTPEVDTVKGAATYTATYSEKIVETTEPEDPQEPREPDPEPEIPEKDWLDDLWLALRIADELGGAQTVEYSGDYALSYDIMNYLVEHPSITLIYNVTYEGVEYTITIPAGQAISYPEVGWYGPLWLLANYGNGNVPTGAKENGTYVVKSGDTLTGISVELGVTVQYLVEKNGIENADVIFAGQLIEY